MADLPLKDSLKNSAQLSESEQKKETKVEVKPLSKPQAPTIVEGNTGTLTVVLLDKILTQLKEMNYYLSFLEKDKNGRPKQ